MLSRLANLNPGREAVEDNPARDLLHNRKQNLNKRLVIGTEVDR